MGHPEEPSSLAAPGRAEFAAALLRWSRNPSGRAPEFETFEACRCVYPDKCFCPWWAKTTTEEAS